MNEEPTDTHNQEVSSEFTKTPVPEPSVNSQNMESLFGNILHQMTKSAGNKDREESENTDEDDYEKLVDQVDNELSDDSDYEDYDVDNRWEAFNKLLDSHQSLCESFRKLMTEDNE